jgi:FkbM family methyltransferase
VNSSLLSTLVSFYVRRFSHRGQERLLSGVEQLLGSHVWTAKSDDGFAMRLNRRDFVQDYILKHGFSDREVSVALKETLKPGDVFYDIGGNIGYFSLLAASLGVQKILAFEPLARLARLAEENVALNGYESVIQVIPLGLGDARGAAHYVPGPDWNSGAGRVDTSSVAQDGVTVQLTTLDDFLAETGTAPPTVIKVDVEGFEANVFRGANRLLADSPPRVIVFEGDCGPSGELEQPEIRAILQHAGYRIQHLHALTHEPKENFIAVLE